MTLMQNSGWEVLVLLQIARLCHRDTTMSNRRRRIAMFYDAHLKLDNLLVVTVLWCVFYVSYF